MAARGHGEEEDYADFLARKYGLGALGQEVELESESGATATEQMMPYPEARRPSSSRPPAARSLAATPSWQRLSRNRAAKRASVDFTQHQHLSTMYHMHRRIAEMYSKSGLGLGQRGEQAEAGRGGGRRGTAQGLRSATSFAAEVAPGFAGSRPSTAPTGRMRAGLPDHPGVAVRVQEPGLAAPLAAPAAAASPSYSKRRVANTAAALKTAILDEIVANRIYEGQRLKALFRSYMRLNAGESFFPTLQQVVEELTAELGVA